MKSNSHEKGQSDENSETENKGIRCRKCNCGHFYVLETRQMLGGRIMRRRECRHCGTRLTSYEKAFGT